MSEFPRDLALQIPIMFLKTVIKTVWTLGLHVP